MTEPEAPAPLTFTWEGEQVEWVDDIDRWPAALLRQADALCGGNLGGLSVAGMRGIMIAVSVAMATGQRVAQVDAVLTVGKINDVREELQAQLDERAAAAAEQLAEAREQAEAELPAVTEPAAAPAAAYAPAPAPPAPAPPGGRDVHFTGVGYVGAVADDGGAGPAVLSPTKPGSDEQ
jgi:hypothetical protein